MKKTIISTALGALTVIGIGSASTAHADGTTPPPWDLYSVPQLGQEPVRGTGCGGDGSIGDVIPDGYWRGYLASDNGASIEFDLACVYFNEVPNSTPVPDGWLVNNKTSTRTVPTSPTFGVTLSDYEDDGSVPFAAAIPMETGLPDDSNNVLFMLEAWLYIENGQAQWVVWAPDMPTSYGSALEYTWRHFDEQQRLCDEVGATGVVPGWAFDALAPEVDEAMANDMVAAFCVPAAAPAAPAASALPPTIVLEASGELFWTDPAFSQEPYGHNVQQDESGNWYFLTDDGPLYLTEENLWGTGDIDGDGIIDLDDPNDSDGPDYDHCGC